MNLPQLGSLSPEVRQLLLFDRSATARFLGTIMVLDNKGQLILDSSTLRPAAANFANEEFFTAHRDFPDYGLYVKGPMKDHLGEDAIAISRRWNRPDGSFGGVVLGTLRLAYFQNLFTKMSLGKRSVMTLMQVDGMVLMRSPYDAHYVGRNIGYSDVFSRISKSPSGSYEGTATIDGVNRIYAFGKIGTLPLIMTVGLAADEVYAGWRREAAIMGLMMILLCAMTIALGTILTNEWRRREDAEQRLSVLAATDPLTGLANRRQFDETIAREWSRAKRSQAPLSLLMIDADHFKAYNDTFGHQAGDALLLEMARCIGAGIKRPADVAARYGGEEFAILLPNTPVYGARDVAALLHASIAKLDAAHPIAPGGKPTVSIGVACLVPRADTEHPQLVRAADAALYEAKSNGRNRTEIAGGSSDAPQTVKIDASGRLVACGPSGNFRTIFWRRHAIRR
jgi:diguanylate cyclase (GGDEF)-like protein